MNRFTANVKLPGSGSLLIGEKGSLLIPHVAAPRLLPEETFKDFQIEQVAAVDHYVGWADACRGVGKTTSHFDSTAKHPEWLGGETPQVQELGKGA